MKLEAIEQTYDQSITLVKCANLQARLAEFLIYSCRADPSGKARCVGFNAITQWIVSELQSEEKSSRIGEAISVAVLSLFSDDVSVARFACSTLRCCVKLIPQLLEYSTLLVESTITALALVTSKLLVSYADFIPALTHFSDRIQHEVTRTSSLLLRSLHTYRVGDVYT